jgi:poly(A) polymerase
MSVVIAPAWLSAPTSKAVMAALEAARPGGARFVGGCVRNALMGRAADDLDIATQLLPEEVIDAVKAKGLSAVPTGIEHGTITVIADHVPFEVTTLRRDVSTDGRRATVAFTHSWEEDAARRDFGMNALYADAAGRVFDPTGQGLDDLRAGRVAFIGAAEDRIREDYLRILRFFRFSAWYGAGALDAVGLAACAREAPGMDILAAERVWKELKKLLSAPDPRPAFTAMKQAGVLAQAAPEFSSEPGQSRFARLVELETEQFLSHDGLQRVAALLADADAARALARRLKISNEERDRLVAALQPGERIVSFLSMRELRRALYRLGVEGFTDRAKLAWAGGVNPRADSQWRALLALAAGWVRPHLPLSGEEVMAAGVAPGPKVGQVLREVEAWWIDADFPDDKLALVERLKAVVQGLA